MFQNISCLYDKQNTSYLSISSTTVWLQSLTELRPVIKQKKISHARTDFPVLGSSTGTVWNSPTASERWRRRPSDSDRYFVQPPLLQASFSGRRTPLRTVFSSTADWNLLRTASAQRLTGSPADGLSSTADRNHQRAASRQYNVWPRHSVSALSANASDQQRRYKSLYNAKPLHTASVNTVDSICRTL